MAARSAALLALAAVGVAAAPHLNDDLILAALRPAFAARSHGRALQQVTAGTSSTRQEQSPEQLGGVIETPLSRALAAGQDAVPGVEPRPFRLAWDVTVGAPRGLSFGASPDDAQEELDYVQQRLLPALNSFLGRSIRVRFGLARLTWLRSICHSGLRWAVHFSSAGGYTCAPPPLLSRTHLESRRFAPLHVRCHARA